MVWLKRLNLLHRKENNMNNQELLKQFMKISELTNPLEQVIQLKKFNKVYKKSEFFILYY